MFIVCECFDHVVRQEHRQKKGAKKDQMTNQAERGKGKDKEAVFLNGIKCWNQEKEAEHDGFFQQNVLAKERKDYIGCQNEGQKDPATNGRIDHFLLFQTLKVEDFF